MDDVILLSSEDEGSSSLPGSHAPSKSPPAFTYQVDDFDYGMTDDHDFYVPSPEVPKKSPSPRKSPSSNVSPWKNGHRAVHTLSDSDASDTDDKATTWKPSEKKKTSISDSDDDLPFISLKPAGGREVKPASTVGEKLSSALGGKPSSAVGGKPSSAVEDFESRLDFLLRNEQYSSPKKNSVQFRENGKVAGLNKREEQRKRKEEEQMEKQKRKQLIQEERDRKKREAAFAKELKQASAQLARAKKAGECLKWITAVLHSGLLSSDYGGELLNALRTAEIQYKVEESLIPCSIYWERQVHDLTVKDNMSIEKNVKIQREKPVLIIWLWDKFLQLVSDQKLQEEVKDILSILPDSELTIVVYGLEDYFRFQKNQKKRDNRANVLGTAGQRPSKKEAAFDTAPRVSRGDIEFALAELQVLLNVCHRCMDSKTDLAAVVCQFSKAVAEAPLKREESRKHAERLDWFAVADSRDGVAIDKDGNGSLRLWQQQLCQFPLAGIDTSEAIASVYPSPLVLVNAYRNCGSEKEAELMLQDIPVRRGPGPLSTTRRIGPQLSKKIYTFFTTSDGDLPISQD